MKGRLPAQRPFLARCQTLRNPLYFPHIPAPPADQVLATVMFTDIVDSTVKAGELGDRRWSEVLHAHDRVAQAQVVRHSGRWVKNTGDGILATFDGPGRAIAAALALLEDARNLGLELRAGLHTGETERRGEDVAGMAVNIAARVAALAGPGEGLVTGTVRDLVAGSGIRFEDRGADRLKDIPDEWQVLAVAS
ncbi:MAG: adenylate/guanylate cyclase domain-containing protein [Acidimicrobiia bacterium]